MSERYWITGVQLGLLIVSPERQGRSKIVDEIIDKQFIGNREDLKRMLNSPVGSDDLSKENLINLSKSGSSGVKSTNSAPYRKATVKNDSLIVGCGKGFYFKENPKQKMICGTDYLCNACRNQDVQDTKNVREIVEDIRNDPEAMKQAKDLIDRTSECVCGHKQETHRLFEGRLDCNVCECMDYVKQDGGEK